MGLLKKLFSIGSRKSKKRSAVDPCIESLPPVQEHLKPCQVDDSEAEVSRLLRSSSARYVAESHIGLSSLPPLPHPIDSVIPPPKSSTTTLASVSARSTYSVTIRSRTVHSRTEFPNAYPPMDTSFTPKGSLTDSARRRAQSAPITPRDKTRVLLLRQDPSVASLLNHYNDEGHLNSTLFSNTPSPQKQGRVQRRSTGSTLRQLLGHPHSLELRNSSTEGDISWAEKFLGETDGNSSVSSVGPRTPADSHFTLTRSIDDKTAPSVECDTSAANHRTFSSLEVELSASTDLAHPQALNSPYGNSMTSQRASQIFGFLGDKKKTQDGPVSRLPQLKTTTPHYRRFSAESTISDTKHSHIPLPRSRSTHIPQSTSPTDQRCSSLASDASRSPLSPTAGVFLPPQPEDKESTLPQPVICEHTGQSSRGLRGPRSPSKIPSRQSTGPVSVPCDVNDSYPVTEQPLSILSVLGEKLNTDSKHINVTTPRSREMHSQIPKLRTASGSSSSSAGSKHDLAINSPYRHPIPLSPTIQMKPKPTEAELPTGVSPHDKENDTLSRLPQPLTPARPFGLHPACLRPGWRSSEDDLWSHHLCEPSSPELSVGVSPHGKENNTLSRLPQPLTPVRPFGLHPHHLYEPSSPASSSELSPVAKQMMTNLRLQRMHARQRERQAGRLGSSQSRIRY